MGHRLTGRDITTLTFMVYDKFSNIADQCSSHADFPEHILDAWRKNKVVSNDVVSEMFVYFDGNGRKIQYNEFIFYQIQTAINKGGETVEDIIDAALNAPLHKETKEAAVIPENEFLSLAYYCAEGGDWDDLDEEIPLAPEVRQELLNTFVGASLRTDVMDLVYSIAGELGKKGITEKRLIQYAVGERLNVPHYENEKEVEYVLTFAQTIKTRDSTKLKGGLVYVAVLREGESCEVCRRLYLKPDGKPKLFYFDELPLNIVNINKDLKDWQPALPPLHIHCTCRLYAYTGYEPWTKTC